VNGDDFRFPSGSAAPAPHRGDRRAPAVRVSETDPVRNGVDGPARTPTIDVTFTEAVTVDPRVVSTSPCARQRSAQQRDVRLELRGTGPITSHRMTNFIAGEAVHGDGVQGIRVHGPWI